ncbi:MAG: DUF421 domain-containing protein [Pelosinus sp.]|nr:DUF421 domain-containing protein [Pelosinus sp.]
MFDINNFGHILLHIVLLSGAALLVVRLMGNRTVGQLSPFDFVIMVGIGDIIITASMDRNQSLLSGVGALVALLILQQLLGYLSLKSLRMRKWFEGTPVTLIQNGQIIRENFVKTHFNYDDLRQELHRQGMDMNDLPSIKLARLESCGMFSIIKHPEYDPLTKKEFENYLQELYNNPLSPLGEKIAKLEQLSSDVEYLVKQMKNSSGKAIPNMEGTLLQQSTQEYH